MPADMKQAIAQAAMGLLMEKGVKKLTVKDIVEECHITRQAFYYHFEDIPELLRWMIEQETDRMLREVLSQGSAVEGLRRFFADRLPQNPMKGEYYLPFAVDELIQAGRATAKVLTTTARWFGVTYREDKPTVCAAIAEMTRQGEYPADL